MHVWLTLPICMLKIGLSLHAACKGSQYHIFVCVDDKACCNQATKTSCQVVLSVSVFTGNVCFNGNDVFRSSTELTFKNVTAFIHSILVYNILTSEEF